MANKTDMAGQGTDGEADRILMDGMFSADFNCNDFFERGTAWSVTVERSDLTWVAEHTARHGQAGLDACLAYIQNKRPHPGYDLPSLNLALDELVARGQAVAGDTDHYREYCLDGPFRKVRVM